MADGRGDSGAGYALLSPTLLVMALALAAPLLLLAVYSLKSQTGISFDAGWTLAQYGEVLGRASFRTLFLRSVVISGLVTLATLLLAYPMAYFVAFHARHKFVWLIALTIPFWTSYLLRVFAWKIILGFNGVINSGLLSLHLIDQPLSFLLYNPFSVVVTLAHAWAAFAILPIYVSLEKIDRSLLEAASDLGDGAVRRFLRITLPLSMPGVIGAAILIFVPTTGDYVTPSLVGGPAGAMIANVIAVQFTQAGNWPLGAALALVSMAMVGVIAGLFVTAARGRDESRKMKNRALLIYALAYLAFLYVPVLFLPVFSFNDSQFIAFPLTGFTTRWYAGLGADTAMQHALGNSLKVGLVTALLSTMLGLTAAKAVTQYRLRGAHALLGFISLPLFIPDIVLGISLLLALGALDLPLSLAAVVLGHMLVCVPFSITVLIARFEGFDRNLEEASADLGESGWMTFWRVTFPLMLPGILASLMLTFITSFDEFLVAYFLSGTEATLPIYIWGQLRFPERLPMVLALGAIILTVSVALVVCAEYVRNLGVKKPMVGA